MSPKKVEVALPLSYRNHITTAISAMSVQASTESANLKSTTEAAESPKSIVPAYATFTDLPQEMVDNILGMHYATIQKPISVAYRGKYYSPRYLGKREPPVMKMGGAYDPLLRVNKNIAETALKIKAQYPVKLRVVYNEDKGFSAFAKLRSSVTTVVFSGMDHNGRSYEVFEQVALVLQHFPNVKEVFVEYTMVRQVYECYSSYDETDIWQKSDGFKTGALDHEMIFPIDRMDLEGIAGYMARKGKEDVRLICRSIMEWNAKGRGSYGAQHIDILITTTAIEVLARSFGFGKY